MSKTDILIITALQLEYDAVRNLGTGDVPGLMIRSWEEFDTEPTPYLATVFQTAAGKVARVALARPTRMAGTSTAILAASLISELKPRCLAMCGVCAGNPGSVALGDVIVAEMAYLYDEGKVKQDGFEGDHRQNAMPVRWVRAAQDLTPEGLEAFGVPSDDDRKYWLLERLYVGDDPAKHPARESYLPGEMWGQQVKLLEIEKLIRRKGRDLSLTKAGESALDKYLFYGPPVQRLPFRIKVGPIASGNIVVKDGMTWDKLVQWGVRSVLGLEMEAAAIGSVAYRLEVPFWVVAKGVMDYADPRKEDRYKAFAAKASAQVLIKFLAGRLNDLTRETQKLPKPLANKVYVIGGVTGETEYPSFESSELGLVCATVGKAIAEAGDELIVCSPFPDSADAHVVIAYVNARRKGKVTFHSPRHDEVRKKREQLREIMGETLVTFVDRLHDGPRDDGDWNQTWLNCQLQALDEADVVVAIGGRVGKSATTLLSIAESRNIQVVAYPFLGGAAGRVFDRTNWAKAFLQPILRNKGKVSSGNPDT